MQNILEEDCGGYPDFDVPPGDDWLQQLMLDGARRAHGHYDTLLDHDGEVARRYGVIGLPTTFMIDRNGRLHARIIGESTPEVFETLIKELL